MIDHKKLGKGALRDLPDDRDLLAAPHLEALPPVDWSKEFRLPDPGNEDQGSSNSCVAQSFSYYHNQLHQADYSRRDLYCRIFQPEGGAYLRDGGGQIVSAGQDTRDHMPDPQPETEVGMRDKTGQNAQAEAAHEELTYNSLSSTIDAVAQAVANFKGAVFGVNGTNEGWQDPTNPRPPQPGETVWGHALYAMGYHTHSDGQKCIIAKSSWCKSGITEHHIREHYFLTGNTFSGWTLIPKGVQMNVKTIGFKQIGDPTVYVQVGSVLVPIADPNAATTLGIDMANSIIELTADQFSKFTLGSGDLFKSA